MGEAGGWQLGPQAVKTGSGRLSITGASTGGAWSRQRCRRRLGLAHLHQGTCDKTDNAPLARALTPATPTSRDSYT